jgi:hypothetical protein
LNVAVHRIEAPSAPTAAALSASETEQVRRFVEQSGTDRRVVDASTHTGGLSGHPTSGPRDRPESVPNRDATGPRRPNGHSRRNHLPSTRRGPRCRSSRSRSRRGRKPNARPHATPHR